MGGALSAQVFLCGLSHIFPLLAVALVPGLVALMTFVARGGTLLSVMAALMVGAGHPGLRSNTKTSSDSVG